MGKLIPFTKDNRELDTFFLELEKLNLVSEDITYVGLDLDKPKMVQMKSGCVYPGYFPVIALNCETSKEQALSFLEQYSGNIRNLYVGIRDREDELIFNKDGLYTGINPGR